MARSTDKLGIPAPDISNLMLNKLSLSLLDEDDASVMKVKPTTAAGAAAAKLPVAAECFAIPYFKLDGRPSGFCRYRYVVDTRKGFDIIAGKKALRYAQPPGSPTEVYLPPFVDWAAIAADPEHALIVTEGELKSACATKHGFPTIGLGGVWSFQSTKGRQELLPILKEFLWDKRTVFICYDSDAATNQQVVMAEQRLAQRLLELGAVVFIVRLPGADDLGKCGLDDFIVQHGASGLAELLDSERCYEYDAAKVLHSLSERVVYVAAQMFVWDHKLQRRMSPADFMNHAFANVHMWRQTFDKAGQVVRTKVPAAREWIKWEARAECLGIAFEPGQDNITDAGYLNTWTGWGVPEPKKGDVSHWDKLLRHLFGTSAESRKWFEQWCAYPLQYPGAKLATAAAIWGVTHGSGKTLVGHTLMRIYGKHSIELKDADLENDRNEWAEAMCFILADDITAKGDRKMMRRLMTMITQKTIMLNPKYIRSYSVADRMNHYYTANEPDMFYMDDGDRRFFIHETLAGKYLDYKAFVKWRDSDEGIMALWAHLLSIDLSDFDPQAPAMETAGKRDMIDMGKSELGAWVAEFKRNADYILDTANIKSDLLTVKQMHALFDPLGNKKTTMNALAREMKRSGMRPAADGVAIRYKPKEAAPEVQCVVWPVRNLERWSKASWAQVRDAYAKANTLTGKKF